MTTTTDVYEAKHSHLREDVCDGLCPASTLPDGRPVVHSWHPVPNGRCPVTPIDAQIAHLDGLLAKRREEHAALFAARPVNGHEEQAARGAFLSQDVAVRLTRKAVDVIENPHDGDLAVELAGMILAVLDPVPPEHLAATRRLVLDAVRVGGPRLLDPNQVHDHVGEEDDTT